MSTEEIAALDPAARRALILEAQTDALKAKEEESRKLTDQAKKLDYFTRALRLESAEVIAKNYAAQVEKDRVEHEKKNGELEEALKTKHAVDLTEKARLSHMQAFRPAFEKDMVAAQKAAYDKEIAVKKAAAHKKRRNEV